MPTRHGQLRSEPGDLGKMKKDEKAYFRDAFLGISHIILTCCIHATPNRSKLTTLLDESYMESNSRMRKRPRIRKCKAVSLAVRRERLRRFVWRDRPRAYEPLEPVELEPWSGDAGLGVAGAGLEVGVGAGAGDTGLGAMWLAGAPGTAGRGAIGAPP